MLGLKKKSLVSVPSLNDQESLRSQKSRDTATLNNNDRGANDMSKIAREHPGSRSMSNRSDSNRSLGRRSLSARSVSTRNNNKSANDTTTSNTALLQCPTLLPSERHLELYQWLDPLPAYPPSYSKCNPQNYSNVAFPIYEFPHDPRVNNDMPPFYEPAIESVTIVLLETEYLSPFDKAPVKSWKHYIMELNSTQLNFYHLDNELTENIPYYTNGKEDICELREQRDRLRNNDTKKLPSSNTTNKNSKSSSSGNKESRFQSFASFIGSSKNKNNSRTNITKIKDKNRSRSNSKSTLSDAHTDNALNGLLQGFQSKKTVQLTKGDTRIITQQILNEPWKYLTNEKLCKSYTLQHGEFGIAADVAERPFCIRLRCEMEQLLISFSSVMDMINWSVYLSTAIGISLDIDERELPDYKIVPVGTGRSRRRRLRRRLRRENRRKRLAETQQQQQRELDCQTQLGDERLCGNATVIPNETSANPPKISVLSRPNTGIMNKNIVFINNTARGNTSGHRRLDESDEPEETNELGHDISRELTQQEDHQRAEERETRRIMEEYTSATLKRFVNDQDESDNDETNADFRNNLTYVDSRSRSSSVCTAEYPNISRMNTNNSIKTLSSVASRTTSNTNNNYQQHPLRLIHTTSSSMVASKNNMDAFRARRVSSSSMSSKNSPQVKSEQLKPRSKTFSNPVAKLWSKKFSTNDTIPSNNKTKPSKLTPISSSSLSQESPVPKKMQFAAPAVSSSSSQPMAKNALGHPAPVPALGSTLISHNDKKKSITIDDVVNASPSVRRPSFTARRNSLNASPNSAANSAMNSLSCSTFSSNLNNTVPTTTTPLSSVENSIVENESSDGEKLQLSNNEDPLTELHPFEKSTQDTQVGNSHFEMTSQNQSNNQEAVKSYTPGYSAQLEYNQSRELANENVAAEAEENALIDDIVSDPNSQLSDDEMDRQLSETLSALSTVDSCNVFETIGQQNSNSAARKFKQPRAITEILSACRTDSAEQQLDNVQTVSTIESYLEEGDEAEAELVDEMENDEEEDTSSGGNPALAVYEEEGIHHDEDGFIYYQTGPVRRESSTNNDFRRRAYSVSSNLGSIPYGSQDVKWNPPRKIMTKKKYIREAIGCIKPLMETQPWYGKVVCTPSAEPQYPTNNPAISGILVEAKTAPDKKSSFFRTSSSQNEAKQPRQKVILRRCKNHYVKQSVIGPAGFIDI
ncbi:hypothetical protein ACO0QE_001114 [Hanseniaspora vineae]